MRYLLGFLVVCALGVMPLVGCSDPEGTGGSGGSAGSGGAGGVAAERAFASRDFERIELRRYEGLGYCPEDGMVISATILRGAEGAGIIGGIRVIDAREGLEQPFGPSPLRAEDTRSLQTLIDTVPAARVPAYVDTEECVFGDGGCDPCLITSLSVDGDHARWSPCCWDLWEQWQELGYSQSFLALVSSIEQLAR